MPRYVLDACVLVPIALTDTLLRLAEKDLYQPLWSDRILGEAEDALGRVRPGESVARVSPTCGKPSRAHWSPTGKRVNPGFSSLIWTTGTW